MDEHEYIMYKIVTGRHDISMSDWQNLDREELWGYRDQAQATTSNTTSYQDLYKCKCGSKNIQTVLKQKRSTDEAPTIYQKCDDCGNSWKQ